MYFTNGNYIMGGNFKIKKAAPMDDRGTVAKKIDLQNPNLFDGFTYNGMIVSVVDDTINNGLYRLEDKSTLTWKKEGGDVDLTNYYTKSETYNKVETNSLVATKQDNLVSGTNIKTINGQSVLGGGDLKITDGGSVQLTGNQTVAGIKTFSSTVVGNITGNSGTATKLETARTINGVAFDGSANITVSDGTKLTKTNPSIIGSITEQVYNLTGAEINPANGTIQYKTISANTTFTETLISGQSVLLRLINANKYTITFPTITWVGAVNPVPVLTANCAIALWKEQSTLYGAYIGTLV